ncbi:MAG: preprotein translocase subunit SecY [Candidatus Epulonipiscioides saccharophilum]|nr:preprotein translocase subunit SecY [Epulopiscium sp. SCG-B10WGA-EpuloB]OON94738.1 MAG: preprotein translocase subunit SecY [Epulopiscium sp. AS2M-Bin001]
MFKTLRTAWKVPDLRKRIMFTFWMMALLRVGAIIPAPGVNPAAIKEMLANIGDNNLLGLMNVFTGGGFSTMAIFAFGVGPYITSSIIIQLLTIAFTKLEEISKEGEDGRKRINRITRYLTLLIAIMQGSATTLLLYNQNILMARTPLYFCLTLLSFVSGSLLVMWIGEQMAVKGVGNGISLIIFVNIVSTLPQTVTTLRSTDIPIAIIALVLIILMIGFAVLMSLGERRIPVQYAKRMSGRKMYGGQSQNIPIKVNLAGVLPVIFAMSLIQFPEIVTNIFIKNPSEGWLTVIDNLRWTTPIGGTIYVVLIFAFAFFYSSIAFNPVDIAANMKKSGGFIPGIRPGKPTSDYLSKIATHVTLVGAIFLSIVALTPVLFQVVLNVPIAFAGTSLLIVVGVALETVKGIESQTLMRSYKGFL